ncbi:hypothetical protein [Paenibacillus sp. NEAU-GSW1]|uniref:hypothetical protein n=1 Tax=Paenibacillus sp. NEAU-GSW1 TaxID=2682486 RepID=UPI0012E1142D|nr:hypothetical protein [Paenibacillus sp. NEAU-GSW1]MUT68594.1 hypothetical protein [Paenibacillus sp. NEAU-GSW1]
MAEAPIPIARGRRPALIANIVIHLLYGLSLPVWYIISMFSVMLFDDPNADQFPPVLILYYSLQSYPYVTVAAIVISWVLYMRRRYRWAVLINLLPVAVVAAGFVPMLIWGQ